MRSLLILPLLALALLTEASQYAAIPRHRAGKYGRDGSSKARRETLIHARSMDSIESRAVRIPSPKIFIISMFDSEGDIWYANMPSILGDNITVPGLSPLYPQAHCTASGEVCQLTTGEGEINAASSISALIYSDLFNLTQTYFLIAGIAGINPHYGTTGSVTFAQYAVQLDLQYEFSASQIPSNDSSGYFPQDAYYPDSPLSNDYPLEIYGTEVFEVNKNLCDRFITLARRAKLNDTTSAAAYRKSYPYAPANQPPSVVACASGTSNVYWSGSVLGDAFYNYTLLLTNGSAHYCATQQEDNASLEALLRGAIAKKVSFSRVAVMRTASDFDRAPPDESEVFHLLYADQEGFLPSIENIYLAGNEIVKDVLANWASVYEKGVAADNYVGDLFNSLPGKVKPNIGTASIYINP